MAAAFQTFTTAGKSTYAGGGAGLSTSPPSGLVAGDLWIIGAAWDSGSGTLDVPSGWTALTANASVNPVHRWFWKLAGGSETAVTLTKTGGDPDGICALSIRVDGQHATPIAAVGTVVTSASAGTTIDPPAATAASTGSLAICFRCVNNIGATNTQPAGMTLIGTATDTASVKISAAYQAVNAGSFDPGVWTFDSGANRSTNTFIIEPSAGGASGQPTIRRFGVVDRGLQTQFGHEGQQLMRAFRERVRRAA